MRCRTIGSIVTITLGLLCAPLTIDAQPPGKVFRIGRLTLASPFTGDLDGFRQDLRELGYVEGQNLVIEDRSAEGSVDRLGALATDLVQRQMDVIVAGGSAAIHAAQQATRTIPIVMMTNTDAVAQGFANSLAHPDGNITGLAGFGVELHGKRLELLKEVVPTATRIAALWNPAITSLAPFLRETQAAAQALGVELLVLEVRTPNEFEDAFAAAISGRAEALIVMDGAFLRDHRTRIVDLAQRHRLPGMYPNREFVDAGGLMSYAPRGTDMGRRAAVYVDKILKGAKPADLPMEQAMKFELVMNLKAAQALGLTLPPHLLVLADEVMR